LEVYGNIICSYNIKEGEINILSDEFENNNNNIIIYIKDQKINFTKKYNFELYDSKRVRFEIISKEFSMKNMFKNVSYLKYINIESQKYIKITSMESAFELCSNIENFSFNSGLDTSKLISMKKAFSYSKKLESISFNKMDLSKVKDISYMIEGTNLYKFTPGVFNLTSVETMSSLF